MKTPLFHLHYELKPGTTFTEPGTDKGAKLETGSVENEEVRKFLEETAHLSYRELMRWLQQASANTPSVLILPLTSRTPESVHYRIGEHVANGEYPKPSLVFITRPLHTIEILNEYLYALNHEIADGSYICCHSMTSRLRRELLEKRYPWGIRSIAVVAHYLWHRVCPKLGITRGFYFAVTKGKNRTFNRVEILGRIYRAGFEVEDENFRDGEYFVTAVKRREPVNDTPPTGSPIIHLRRIGLNGKPIIVHKFRTMYTYSEYIQPYIYQYQHLDTGGKFKNDYRVNIWGRLLRATWLDELPMVWNMLRGEMKLVGVRPLSPHYFSLYTPEMQALRTKTKPGLLPPFYYDEHTPETIEEVQESERRYLEAYLKAPFKTDWRYFWGIVGNILFRRKRSK